jgi:AraC-like DNA-binding protein
MRRRSGVRAVTAGQADWTISVNDLFQRLIGLLSTYPSLPSEIESLLKSIPKPKDGFERIVVSHLVYQTSLMLVQSTWVGHLSDKRLETALEAISQIRNSDDPIARLAVVIQEVTAASVVQPETGVIDRILTFVHENYTTKLTAATVAQHVKTSAARVNRQFQQAMGLNLRQYVQELRVQQGLSRIAKGMKVKDAATAVGYKSRKDFYRAVRIKTGGTPRQARHRVRNRSKVPTKNRL